MCLNLRRFCVCGRNSTYLSCRDNLLPGEILLNLFCPECRPDSTEEDTMLQDCGWVLEYDVERAQAYFDLKSMQVRATPGFIFDAGYLSWQGLAPGDQEINTRLHQRLAPLIKQDLALYLQSLRAEWVAHVAQLKAAGWRKAQAT
ncbi:MAG: hypothetical protein M0P73_04150 [Syntrophobacterales bacterium]|jgi:hypothetical protein|nr:hypothetical protein [Syntrophobacterales bacterium]